MDKADDEVGYKLEALAAQAGVSPRTVRYYVQRGLLPPPVFRGRDTLYGPEHLTRLVLIRRFQRLFVPLDRIAAVLDRAGAETLAAASDEDLLERATEGDAQPDSEGGTNTPEEPPGRSPERWARWCLVAGVELWVSEGADPGARALVERLLAEVARGARDKGDGQ
ncbi:MAG: MerR family transcriptional regulator [Deltaproteobacteria bacterium]|nr:MerR family transcriptional regulator [Deltaproteobacteria bacterium]